MEPSKSELISPGILIEKDLKEFVRCHGNATEDAPAILLFPWDLGPILRKNIRYQAAVLGLATVYIRDADLTAIAVCRKEFIRESGNEVSADEDTEPWTVETLKAALEASCWKNEQSQTDLLNKKSDQTDVESLKTDLLDQQNDIPELDTEQVLQENASQTIDKKAPVCQVVVPYFPLNKSPTMYSTYIPSFASENVSKRPKIINFGPDILDDFIAKALVRQCSIDTANKDDNVATNTSIPSKSNLLAITYPVAEKVVPKQVISTTPTKDKFPQMPINTKGKRYSTIRASRTGAISESCSTSDEGSHTKISLPDPELLEINEIAKKLSYMIEVYEFPGRYTTNIFLNIFNEEPRYVRWYDEEHVLVIFGSPEQAMRALSLKRKYFKTRAMTNADPPLIRLGAKFRPANSVKFMSWSRTGSKKK